MLVMNASQSTTRYHKHQIKNREFCDGTRTSSEGSTSLGSFHKAHHDIIRPHVHHTPTSFRLLRRVDVSTSQMTRLQENLAATGTGPNRPSRPSPTSLHRPGSISSGSPTKQLISSFHNFPSGSRTRGGRESKPELSWLK
ncbi:hypothetical protein HPP92_019909 [Vanilla planifolia]|uniref:Uncharacterized protein n=1 Tax=Vanilla planifolia TaxID=51239 RepID=A0A835UM81_VANPL|nr:hypothetical protein HPP92_019909 [Vanilla planifolia]